MSAKVLITYATKYGATLEIAEKITETLRAHGLNVEMMPAEDVRDVTPYQAVIVGSAVYVGQWRKEAVHFLESHADALAQRAVWAFSSGPTGEGDPAELMKGWTFPEAQKPLAEQIHVRDTALFHGHLNPQKMNFGEKLIVKGIKAPIGDFRDWSQITEWAAHIAETLQSEIHQPNR